MGNRAGFYRFPDESMFYVGVHRARKERGFLGMDDGKKGKVQGNDPLHRHR